MKTRARFLFAIVVAGLPAVASRASAQAGSPIDEILNSAKSALEVLNYRQADSLSRSALAFGPVLTKAQQILALQVSIGAAYPEDKPNERQTDSAVARIRHLLAIDRSAWDRNLTWDGIDSLRALVVRASRPAKVVLGTRTPNALLFIDGKSEGMLGSLRVIELPPDTSISLSIRADKCVAYDTTIRVRAADSIIIGRRTLTCTP